MINRDVCYKIYEAVTTDDVKLFCETAKILNKDMEMTTLLVFIGVMAQGKVLRKEELKTYDEIFDMGDVTPENYRLGYDLYINAQDRYGLILRKEIRELKEGVEYWNNRVGITDYNLKWATLFIYSLPFILILDYIFLAFIASYSLFYLVEKVIFKNKNLMYD